MLLYRFFGKAPYNRYILDAQSVQLPCTLGSERWHPRDPGLRGVVRAHLRQCLAETLVWHPLVQGRRALCLWLKLRAPATDTACAGRSPAHLWLTASRVWSKPGWPSVVLLTTAGAVALGVVHPAPPAGGPH
jgi:hypothetical protein